MIRNAALAGTAVLFVMMCSNGEIRAADPPASGFADPVLGQWDLTVEGSDGPYPSWLDVQLRTEQQLMARFVGRFGSVRHATAVTYDGDTLTVRVPVQYEAADGDLVFSGSVVAGKLVGEAHMGDGTVHEWLGVRAPLPADRYNVRWEDAKSLINADMSGWRMRNPDHPGCWSVTGGVLKVSPPCVDIITEEAFADFRLQLEFRYPPGSNSGVYLRGRYEVQIQDDHGKALDPLRLGGVYGFLAPQSDASRPAGEWQRYDIVLLDRRITVVLNGREILTDRIIPGITGGALDSHEGAPGPIMLQGDHGPIEYRNIVITPSQGI